MVKMEEDKIEKIYLDDGMTHWFCYYGITRRLIDILQHSSIANPSKCNCNLAIVVTRT